MTISIEKLRKLRTNHGWSQERLSEVSGVSLRTIQRIESGENVSLETQLAISKVFNVAPADLFENCEVEVGQGGINWSGIVGITICFFMMLLQFLLPGSPFFEPYSLVLVIGLAFAMSAISLGLKNTLSTIAMIRWVAVLPKRETGLENRIPYLYRFLLYCHTAGVISTLVGIIAVFMTPASYDWNYNPEPESPMLFGLGIALLTLLYASMFAELILRPLKHQLENLIIVRNSQQTE